MKLTLDPKGDFLKDGRYAGAHGELMANPSVRHAIGQAQLQFLKTRNYSDPATLATIGLQIKGMTDFIDILLNLGEKELPRTTPVNDDLVPVEEAWASMNKTKK